MTQDTNGARVLTFLGSDGEFYTINSDTIGFDKAFAAVLADDTEAATIAAIPLNTIVSRLQAVNAEFGTDGNVVTRAGKALSDRLSTLLLDYARKGDEALTALGKFIGLLDNNPSARSVQSLYDWIESSGLTLNSDGFIVGYKGVLPGIGGEGYLSSH